jgi:hypothetical protein
VEWFRSKEPEEPDTAEDRDQPQPEPEHILREVRAVRRIRRWDVRDEPFEGFGSPSGRF